MNLSNVVKECPIDYTPCCFPYCTKEVVCKKGNVNIEVDTVTSIKQYFNYQEELNTLKNKITKLENAQNEIYDEIKIDITSVLLVYNLNNTDFDMEFTDKGIVIELYLKKYNDYSLVHSLNTDLFNALNELMNKKNAELNITGEEYIAGNKCMVVQLVYE